MITSHKERAIELRKEGKTYREILQEIRVAKSTLSGWLKDISLAKSQEHRITLKKRIAQRKAVEAVKLKRKKVTQELINSGIKDIDKINARDLFILGVGLYWAEGAKQKEVFNISQAVDFTNSDVFVIKVFLRWLYVCCGVDTSSIKFELYIHESVGVAGIKEAVKWWKSNLGIAETKEIKCRLKRHELSSRRHIFDYHGQFRVKVLKSTNLNRKISGWIAGIMCNF